MARFIVQYGLPLVIVLPIVWWLVRMWYLKAFAKTVDNKIEIDKASVKYDKKLNSVTVKKKVVKPEVVSIKIEETPIKPPSKPRPRPSTTATRKKK